LVSAWAARGEKVVNMPVMTSACKFLFITSP
jgi:hypothetical protein